MASATKTKWKNSCLLPNALQSDVQLCNSCYMGKEFFSEVISTVCSWDSENCSHGNNVFVMARMEKRGERTKREKWVFKRRKRGSRASWVKLNWHFCADLWHLHICCLYKYHQNSEQVNFKWAQKTGREAKGQFTDVRRGFSSSLMLELFHFCTAEMSTHIET